jgi:hypothetical protein
MALEELPVGTGQAALIPALHRRAVNVPVLNKALIPATGAAVIKGERTKKIIKGLASSSY